MKVILLKDVKGVGRIHEVKDVADGYAINSLFPRKLAEAATEDKIAAITAAKAKHEQEAAQQEEALIGRIRSLMNATLEIHARATEKGGLFKAVTAQDIVRAIHQQKSVELPESAVALDHPLKTMGTHEVVIVHKAVRSTVTVTVINDAK